MDTLKYTNFYVFLKSSMQSSFKLPASSYVIHMSCLHHLQLKRVSYKTVLSSLQTGSTSISFFDSFDLMTAATKDSTSADTENTDEASSRSNFTWN